MKIVFVTNNYTPYSGGVVSSINALVPELQQQGHQVFIITLDFVGAYHQDPSYVFRIPCPIKFRYRCNYMAVPWRMNYHVEKLIQTLKPDIIHSHHPWLLGSAALRIAKKFKIPIIFTYHTLYDHYAHYVPVLGVLTRPIINYLVKKYCAAVDVVIAPSSAVHERVAAYNISTPCMIVPSPLAPEFINQPLHQKELKKPYKLLVVSRLVKEKNLPVIFDVFEQLYKNNPGDVELTVVGYGAYAEYLKKYVYEVLQLPHQAVIFLDKKSKNELIPLYQSAHLFLFSSLSDTQGLVLAEAMSCGTPVVALDGPGQRDNVKNGINGFLVNSPLEMVKIIQNIVQHCDAYKKLSYGAYEIAQRYSPKLLAQNLLVIYHKYEDHKM